MRLRAVIRGVIQAVLIKLHLKTFSVEALYSDIMSGAASETDLYRAMRPHQVPAFIALHERVKSIVESGPEDFDPDILTLTPTVLGHPGRLQFAFMQVDRIIEKDLVKNIKRVQGTGNVVSRED